MLGVRNDEHASHIEQRSCSIVSTALVDQIHNGTAHTGISSHSCQQLIELLQGHGPRRHTCSILDGEQTDGNAKELLGEDELVVDDDLELAAATGDEGEPLDRAGELLEEFLRRPRGACGVVSDNAVGDRDFELCVCGHSRFAPHVSQ